SSIGRVATGTYECWATNCELPIGVYEFDEEGRMLQGLVSKDDGNYYYINGNPATDMSGITKIGDDYYFVSSIGRVATGKYYCWATNCELPVGNYEFDEEGRMLQGIVSKSDGNYYYVNGKIAAGSGLMKIDGYYYFVASNGKCATGTYYAWATSCDLPCSTYEFGADGKMLHGMHKVNGEIGWYVNGKLGGVAAGLTKFGDDYYFVATNGKIATGRYYCWATNCELPIGSYEFDETGKMIRGFVEKSDGIYFYINGNLAKEGLYLVDGHYYYATEKGTLITNRTYHVTKTNGLLIEATYTFNELGQIVE
ncbi:MAG: hypothetical protein J6L88_07950, partial [Clostridia bacterium]|nr:hypothetical protein [Clostridia bacterium]